MNALGRYAAPARRTLIRIDAMNMTASPAPSAFHTALLLLAFGAVDVDVEVEVVCATPGALKGAIVSPLRIESPRDGVFGDLEALAGRCGYGAAEIERALRDAVAEELGFLRDDGSDPLAEDNYDDRASSWGGYAI
jgi:hypothetical protein